MPEIEDGGCDVCVLDGGYADSIDSFCQLKTRKARKPHQCCECAGTIQPGESYEHAFGQWDGTVSTFKTCSVCVEIRAKFSCGRGWMFQNLWEDLREGLFDRLTTGCLTGLSVAAHEKVLAAWRVWKGLETT
jgi:hypothetical protein